MYRCDSCKYESNRKADLLRHLHRKRSTCFMDLNSLHEMDEEAQFPCRVGCPKQFKHDSSRIKHEVRCVRSFIHDVIDTTPQVADVVKQVVKQVVKEKPPTAKKTVPSCTKDEEKENPVGYIYLLREREFLQNNLQVFKIGMTVQCADPRIRRIHKYKKGSEVVLVMEVYNHKITRLVETEIIKKFQQMFINHNDGHEYFVGCRIKMTKVITDIVIKFNSIKKDA